MVLLGVRIIWISQISTQQADAAAVKAKIRKSRMSRKEEQFIDDVKAGRGERLADDPRLFSGLIWTGEQAERLGLIDGLKSVDDLSRERFGEVRVEDYTPGLDPFERLSRQFGRVAAQWLGLPSAAAPIRYQLAP